MNLQSLRFSRRVVYSTLVAVIALSLFLMLPISLNWTIPVPCKILPAREWLLMKNEEGGVLATFSDYMQGSVDNYSVMSVIRGDAFQFDLTSALKPGDLVGAGDTVVKIYSHELARQLSRLSGELAVAKASLAVMKSGEKQAITQEAERNLVLAREKAETQNLIFQRQDSLYRRNLISREAFDLARSAAQMSAIEVAIAEARLQTVRTGAKPEEIRMIESQIEGLESEISALSNQMGNLTLVSPFLGIFQSSPGTDTLCVVEDTARVVLMPVPTKYLGQVAPGQSVKLRVPSHTEWFVGTVLRLEKRVRIINGVQVMMATATLNGGRALPSNLIVMGAIETGRLSPVQYLIRWISELFR
ncbi:MAG: hypothetical protein ONB44_00390 [candidate division KSB1 bacterium]|nr:hypothetical protein [candidate division KSB1 bacterium]MDZ7300579.1 hypothetical protein [candidate division KSB1 bacterium]MDZ7309716.1 hypothetical protein [candidate division KSB1 bacterium]